MAKNKNTVVELVETTTEIEAPYELPEGWKWCRLGDVAEIARGGSPRPIEKYLTNSEDGINWIKIGDTEKNGKYIYSTKEKIIKEGLSKTRYVEEGDFLLTNSMSFGRPYILKTSGCIHDGWLVIKQCEKFIQDFLYYLLSSPFVFQQFMTLAKGSTVKNLKSETVREVILPLPPTLEEQQRIVNRIETLFAKLDQAKEKAQNVVDTFETRKASILHKAFNNQLKIDNGELKDEDWVETTIGETVKLLSGQDFKPEDYNDLDNGIPYITGASNFEDSHVIINRWTTKPTVIARKNDVLLVCKGSGYGKTIIADFDEAHIARQIMALQPNDKVNNKYIQYFLQNNYEYLRNCGQGLIPGISRSVVLEMKIKLPPINYQLSIVNFLDTVLEKETKAKEAAEAVLEQIDLLKKSILARAFRGEL